MEAHTKSIISVVSPMEAIFDLGLEPSVENELCVINCPNCNSAMFVLDTGFVCGSHACNFKAGGVIDIIALIERIPIKKAFNRYRLMFDDKLRKIARHNDVNIVNDTYKHLQNKRKLLEFFIRNKRRSFDKASLIQAEGALGKVGIDMKPNMLSGVLLDKDKQVEFNKLLSLFGKSLPVVPQKTALLVIPYFSNHHTIDSMVVCTPARPKRPPKLIEVGRTSKLTWAGLLQMHPAANTVELSGSFLDMLHANTKHAKTGSGSELSLHCHYRGSIPEIGWSPENAVFLLPDEPIINPVLTIAKLDESIPNLSLDRQGNSLSIRKYIVESCIEGLLREGLSATMRLQVQAAQLTDEERDYILITLHDKRKFDLASDLKCTLHVHVVHREGDMLLFHSPSGYLYAKGESDQIPVSNFTLDIKENLVFSDSQDLFHIGTLSVESKTYDLILRPNDIDRIADLEMAIRNCVGQSELKQKLPTICDKYASKLISSYLRHKIAEVPNVEGIPFLGWNPKRTRFYGPFFQSNENGCDVIKGKMHPSVSYLEHFFTQHDNMRVLDTNLPGPILNIIAQFACVITRSYLRMPVKAIPVSNDEIHRATFMEIFKGVGQISPVQLNNNIRTHTVKDIDGFCAYALGYNMEDATKRESPLFCMCDGGPSIFPKTYNDRIIKRAHSTLQFVVFATLDWISKTNAAEFKTSNGVAITQNYINEGVHIIDKACGSIAVKDWGSAPVFNTLESFLAEVTYDEVNKFVNYNVNAHIVTLDLTSRPDIDLSIMEDELLELGAKNVSFEGSKITADAKSIMGALESYYERKPEVEEEFDAVSLLTNS